MSEFQKFAITFVRMNFYPKIYETAALFENNSSGSINCAPLVADLFLFCYERDFMTSLSDVKQAEIIEAFKSTSR